jgi:ABC-type dipeptide/oligopeptide/nickel transport system ATPase component
MPTISDEIAALPSGARFVRADLHIHSFGASHDVKDPAMTPKGVVETAVAEGLALIALTDHNEITNVEFALAESTGRSILLIPGVELSTPQGHLLVYFAQLSDLKDFHGKLAFAGRGTANSRCQTAMLDCLKLIDPVKGFAILAHVDDEGGLEKTIQGHPPHKGDILNQVSLLGIELRNATSPISYSPADPDPQRAAFGQQRIKVLGIGSRQFLARVMFSDSHSLSALGKNTQGNRRVTRIKMMETPSFNGLRIALQDADARIRLEDEIPQSVPYLMGLKIEGGFLDGQCIHFSRNLNCIIGGRGAGKSTAFESARCISPSESASRLVDSEVWPVVLHLVWVDEAGTQHTLVRRIAEGLENVDDPDFGPTAFPMETYGQGETADTSTKAQSDPTVLLGYLDRFVDLSGPLTEEQEVRDLLLTNQTEIEKAQLQVARIPETKRLLTTTQQQLLVLEREKAQEVVALERKVAEERTLRESVDLKVTEVSNQARQSAIRDLLKEIEGVAKPDELKVGAAEFKAILGFVSKFEADTKAAEGTITKGAQELLREVKKQLEQWRSREHQIVLQIETKRKELASKGIKLDLAYIRKLAGDEATYTKSLKALQTWEPHLKQLLKNRLDLLSKRQALRTRIFTARTAYGRKATSALRDALGDLSVAVRFTNDALSPEAEEIIQKAMNWRTSQVPRAALLVEKITVPRLLHSIRRSDPTALVQLRSDDGSAPFNKAEALEVVKNLSPRHILFQLERCEIADRPKITVTKKVSIGGKVQYIPRDFSKLSLGQQQSVLLALMLSSDSNAPLIIDQPEDNLDGEFIFHSLVPVLRAAKERRQVIVVTHNANIAVLGDAEQIIALKSTSDKSLIVARGSIDDPATKKMACQILEGSEEAFRRRATIYGLKY